MERLLQAMLSAGPGTGSSERPEPRVRIPLEGPVLHGRVNEMTATLRDVASNYARINSIVLDDAQKRKRKRELNGTDTKEPFGTEQEVAETQERIETLREAINTVERCIQTLETRKQVYGARQHLRMEKKARKIRTQRSDRHCIHCQGRASSCSCTDDCPAAEAEPDKPHPKCFLHCKHCSGRKAACECRAGCSKARLGAVCAPVDVPASA